jgi:uncharacterized protein (TIGR02996 family)
MTTNDYLFLLELLTPPLERQFIKTLTENPRDAAARAAYADWLEEQGRDYTASQVRGTAYVPGRNLRGLPDDLGFTPAPFTYQWPGVIQTPHIFSASGTLTITTNPASGYLGHNPDLWNHPAPPVKESDR